MNDAGVASALLNASQQIGGSLGTALLNTFYASAVTDLHRRSPPARRRATAFDPLAAIHGYHVAFCRVGLLVGALVAVVVLVNAKKDDIAASRRAPGG